MCPAACRAANTGATGRAREPAIAAEGEAALARLPPQHVPARAGRCRQHDIGVPSFSSPACLAVHICWSGEGLVLSYILPGQGKPACLTL